MHSSSVVHLWEAGLSVVAVKSKHCAPVLEEVEERVVVVTFDPVV